MNYDLEFLHGAKDDLTEINPAKGIGVSGSMKQNSDLTHAWGTSPDTPMVAEQYAMNPHYGPSIRHLQEALVKADSTVKNKAAREALADFYKAHPDYNQTMDGAAMYPLLYPSGKVKTKDGKNKAYWDSGALNPNAESRLAEKQKYDTLVINNFRDPPVTGWGGGLGTHIAAIHPERLRSRFAAFDPARRHEADLLGAIRPELLPVLSGLGLLGLESMRSDDR